ncbi:hypothetical protein AGR7C_pAt0012 [Agrobacterium deltaense Zutra 3/1]|uniref:Uncharacterized protein n=1 Tax=Agrobacterium deltaense Zutra 3/1 TaxID=1183427 RepID=A0A1S7S1K9_9HYPH|nr:hypothetical protein AGR7C_pAt0012 [Agrobacterium deltaense Zutra 3/1]
MGARIKFHCLEECTNRIEAIREAAWARALSKRGYDLGNTWTERKATSKTDSVPLARLANLRLSKALVAGLQFGLSCALWHHHRTASRSFPSDTPPKSEAE